MIDWNIQSRAHQCQACGRAFADKEPYHTVLSDEKGEYVRQDVCEPCWKGQYSQGAQDRKGFISHWHGVYEAPAPAAPEVIQKENAETLLRKIMEAKEPKYAAVSFILAVMLERKRLLKVKEQFKVEGRRVFVYEQPKTGDVFTIPDPDLQLNQLEQVQHDVAFLLEHGLPGAAAPVSAPAEPAAPPPNDPDEPDWTAEADAADAAEAAAATSETPAPPAPVAPAPPAPPTN